MRPQTSKAIAHGNRKSRPNSRQNLTCGLLPKLIEDRQIRSGPIKSREIAGRAPTNPLMLMRMQVSAGDHTEVGPQADRAAVIGPAYGFQGVSHRHLHAEFFAQLTDQRGFRGFAGFHLATRKFPLAAEMFSLRPETGEKTALFIPDHTSNHFNHRGSD